MYVTPAIEIPDEETLARQQQAVQSVEALRDEIAETAPAKMVKFLVGSIAAMVIVGWLLGRR